MSERDFDNLRLDLAPKLNRPLSLWNPLDYLRLLLWAFYFPQALRWYVDRFGGGHIPYEQMNWFRGFEILRTNQVQRSLLLQSIVLTVVTPTLLCSLLEQMGDFVDWTGVTVAVTIGIVISITSSVAVGVAGGVAVGMLVGVAVGIAIGIAGGIAVGMAIGMAVGIAGGVSFSISFGVAIGIAFGIIVVLAEGVTFGVAEQLSGGLSGGILFSVAFCIAFILGFLRPDSWFLGTFLKVGSPKGHFLIFGSITPMALPYTALSLQKAFQRDWLLGVHNTNEFLKYTYQFIPVLSIINKELDQLSSSQLLSKVALLSNSPFDWPLIEFCSVSLGDALRTKVINSLFFLPFKQRIAAHLSTSPRLDTLPFAAAAGFWYLHEAQPAEAAQAFAVVRDIRHGEEMFGLASLLAMFDAAETAAAIAAIQLPDFPEDRTLRPQTWEAIRRFCHVISDTQTVQLSASRSARAFANSRALGELQQIIEHEEDLPEAERSLVIKIAETWQQALLEDSLEVGAQDITQPVRNPYVVGDPVEGDLFVGRDDIMRQLQELWLMGNHLQSVVIYGHRRMGKTSILKNVSRLLGATIKVAYVNLLKVSWAENASDILTAITDQVAAAMDLKPPDDATMVAKPERTFERFLTQAIGTLSEGEGLIIAIDEFEKIEELIKAGKLDPGFMGYLRGLLQDSPKLAFAFAGLHTLEEMSADYFQPFFASVLPIKVDFFKASTVQALLPNPDGDFPLDYDFDALDLIWHLTAGQPYLTQLVGFQLVRRYNDQVFEHNQKHDPQFTAEDVRAVVERPEFFAQGKQYFLGVWSQASNQCDVPGQYEILKTLALYEKGMDVSLLLQESGLEKESFNAALSTLENHDVIRRDDGTVCMIVELFRRWLVSYSGLVESP